MNDEMKNLFEIIFSGIQLFVLIVGGIWAYFRFRREGTYSPRIEFSISCKFFHSHNKNRIAHVVIHARNKGNIEHKFVRISLKLRGIKAGTNLVLRSDKRADFSESLIKAELIPEEVGYFFVRPNVEQQIAFTTIIPENIAFVLAHAAFKYENSEDLHTAEDAFEVETAT